ncbi:unnamed protein product [Angiostrongylus costaricensis]|uniref:Endo/exonuclease/phosphatase domain-containing protein n=1 Tax=Angiostrongylus costaricensis TaxID=334426 RepID=A0A0R3PSA0_ANGCS|nr:unnamed protein product [Angiostrongylus costaricensis]
MFYYQLEKIILKDKWYYKFLVGDLNARKEKANESQNTRPENLNWENEMRMDTFLQDFCLRHVSSEEIHISRRKKFAAGHGNRLTVRRILKSTNSLQFLKQ